VSCEPEQAQVWPSKDPADALDHYVDFEDEGVRKWTADTDFGTAVRLRPVRGNGFEYESNGGRSGLKPPVFPTVIGQTVTDGSQTLTCRAVSTASLRKTVAGTPTWIADSGITVSSPGISGTRASAVLSGGVDGQEYTVLVDADFTDGTSKTATCILPVSRPVRVCNG